MLPIHYQHTRTRNVGWGSFSQNRRKADNEVNNRTAVVSERDFVRGSLTWRNVAYKVSLPQSPIRRGTDRNLFSFLFYFIDYSFILIILMLNSSALCRTSWWGI